MLFSSQVFILGFLPVALAGFFLLGRLAGGRAALVWLIAASLVFYGWGSLRHVPLLAGSVVANLLLSRWIAASVATGHARTASWLLRCGIAANLALLGWLKYAGLATEMLSLVPGLAIPRPAVALPLGISFFTFQQTQKCQPISMGYGRTNVNSPVGFLPANVRRSSHEYSRTGPI
jgi:D-alanyl-lipoteichoic acid acyltransferase DltB (MBOAT superfamily)